MIGRLLTQSGIRQATRISARTLPPGQLGFGRLVRLNTAQAAEGIYEATYDTNDQVATFSIPSKSESPDIHICQLDMQTLEVVCPCKHARCRLQGYPERDVFDEWFTRPYKNKEQRREYLDKYATYLESLSLSVCRLYLFPLITRVPSGGCPHSRKIQRFLRRNGIWGAIKDTEAGLVARLEARIPKESAA